jgi:biopolymer transport protein ExbD
VPHYQLQVQADEAVPYGRVAQVMALAQTAGLNKLTFITIPHK